MVQVPIFVVQIAAIPMHAARTTDDCAVRRVAGPKGAGRTGEIAIFVVLVQANAATGLAASMDHHRTMEVPAMRVRAGGFRKMIGEMGRRLATADDDHLRTAAEVKCPANKV